MQVPLRALIALVGVLTFGADARAQEHVASTEVRTLLLRTGLDARALHDEVSLQLVEWDVVLAPTPEGARFLQRAARAEAELGEHDAAAWLERRGDEERLVVVTRTDELPRTSPLPRRTTPDWERVVAMVLDGLLTSDPHGVRLARTEADASSSAAPARPRVSRWRSPLARNGWMFRFGWYFAMSPREANWEGAYTDDGRAWTMHTGGARLRVSRWLLRFLRVDVSAHLGKTFESGPEAGLDVELMAVSDTRFRMGAGIGFGGLMAIERDGPADGRFGWTGWWVHAPMEIGSDFNRRGGIYLQIGPTWTKPPYLREAHPGFMMSLETEFDFGARE